MKIYVTPVKGIVSTDKESAGSLSHFELEVTEAPKEIEIVETEIPTVFMFVCDPRTERQTRTTIVMGEEDAYFLYKYFILPDRNKKL